MKRLGALMNSIDNLIALLYSLGVTDVNDESIALLTHENFYDEAQERTFFNNSVMQTINTLTGLQLDSIVIEDNFITIVFKDGKVMHKNVENLRSKKSKEF
ncbi:hypothetical protein RND61_14685 [Streptomyces sp. TRM76323]|uniref:Uncharacterized protein n=1 Tax=Streptomyces tamarix TaxID=3078565 RepID=A0ABU3QKM1_9ACTN|nr:hypothetical protein [Streptomyces tamarix]MDT9683309.1 hypothetical protein [Streptomyces tamarix]